MAPKIPGMFQILIFNPNSLLQCLAELRGPTAPWLIPATGLSASPQVPFALVLLSCTPTPFFKASPESFSTHGSINGPVYTHAL